MEGVDEDLLQLMLREKHEHEEQLRELALMRSEEDEDENAAGKDQKLMFKNRKKPVFKDYNKIIA